MNAAEARKRRGGSTLVERSRKDPERAARIDMLVAEASVEHALQELVDIENVASLPLLDNWTEDESLGYDEHGLRPEL